MIQTELSETSRPPLVERVEEGESLVAYVLKKVDSRYLQVKSGGPVVGGDRMVTRESSLQVR